MPSSISTAALLLDKALAPHRVAPPERDPLLVCLALTAKRIDREVHLSTLRAGFAVDDEGRIAGSAYPDRARLHGDGLRPHRGPGRGLERPGQCRSCAGENGPAAGDGQRGRSRARRSCRGRRGSLYLR